MEFLTLEIQVTFGGSRQLVAYECTSKVEIGWHVLILEGSKKGKVGTVRTLNRGFYRGTLCKCGRSPLWIDPQLELDLSRSGADPGIGERPTTPQTCPPPLPRGQALRSGKSTRTATEGQKRLCEELISTAGAGGDNLAARLRQKLGTPTLDPDRGPVPNPDPPGGTQETQRVKRMRELLGENLVRKAREPRADEFAYHRHRSM
jgi:hypothetical protein